jgi:hypothetical protein
MARIYQDTNMRAILALALLFSFTHQAAAGPPADRVITKGSGPVPGALVCPDYRALQAAFRSFSGWRGPRPDYFGCTLVMSGTALTMVGTDPGGAPVVSGLLPNGAPVRGVTLRDMVDILAPPKPRKAAVSPPKPAPIKPGASADAPSDAVVKGTMPLPQIQNSPDTFCQVQKPCSDEEFAARLAIVEKRWALMPDSLQKGCAESSTLTLMEQCIAGQTSAWMNAHPTAETPWMDPELVSQ